MKHLRPHLSPWKRLQQKFFGKKCFYCDEISDSIDHKVPIIKGGNHRRENLIAACDHCNREKSDMDHDLYYRYVRRFGKPKIGWARNGSNKTKLKQLYVLTTIKKLKIYSFDKYIIERYNNHIESEFDFKCHNELKNAIEPNCTYCKMKTFNKYERVFCCEDCIKCLNITDVDVLYRFFDRFGIKDFHYFRETNKGKILYLNSMYETSKSPIGFFNKSKYKFDKYIIKRFLKHKRNKQI